MHFLLTGNYQGNPKPKSLSKIKIKQVLVHRLHELPLPLFNSAAMDVKIISLKCNRADVMSGDRVGVHAQRDVPNFFIWVILDRRFEHREQTQAIIRLHFRFWGGRHFFPDMIVGFGTVFG